SYSGHTPTIRGWPPLSQSTLYGNGSSPACSLSLAVCRAHEEGSARPVVCSDLRPLCRHRRQGRGSSSQSPDFLLHRVPQRLFCPSQCRYFICSGSAQGQEPLSPHDFRGRAPRPCPASLFLLPLAAFQTRKSRKRKAKV